MPSEQVDLLTLDRAYYLEPDSASPKAYVLLRKTLEQTDRTAIVRFSLRQKTRLAALRVRGDVLVLQTLLWADEVREAAFPALDEPVRISAKELELSASLVESFAADFDPTEFVDEYQQELRTLIEAKLEKGDALDTSETFGEQRGGDRAARSSTSWRRCARASSAVRAARRAKPRSRPRPRALRASRRSRPRRSRSEGEDLPPRRLLPQDGCPDASGAGQTVVAVVVAVTRGRARRPRGRARGACASSASVTTSSPAAAAFLRLAALA